MTLNLSRAMWVVRVTAVLAVGWLAGCAHRPAGSAACVPVPQAEMALQYSQNVPVIHVQVNGQAVAMLVDLGADKSLLTERAATALKLERTPVDIRLMVGTGGFSRRLAALADHLQIGSITRDNQRFEVADAELGEKGRVIDGLIGLDILREYDLDLDLPHSRLTLNKPADCDGPPPGWDKSAVRVAVYHPIPNNVMMGMPAALNGRDVSALLDSGASYSMIGAATAQAAGFVAGGPGQHTGNLGGIGADRPTATTARFHSLAAAGDTIAEPMLLVGPVESYTDMMLGADFLHLHRVWIPADADAIWFGPRTVAGRVSIAPKP